MNLDDQSDILAKIVRLKSRLVNIVEPDFGLLDELLSMAALTLPELADVQSKRIVYKRNKAALDLLATQDHCDKFVKALQRTSQQHVVNFITQNGGEKHHDVLLLSCVRCKAATQLAVAATTQNVLIGRNHGELRC